jgi:hypothetical protein
MCHSEDQLVTFGPHVAQGPVMLNRKNKRLTLDRESLQSLGKGTLTKVAGGASVSVYSAPPAVCPNGYGRCNVAIAPAPIHFY